MTRPLLALWAWLLICMLFGTAFAAPVTTAAAVGRTIVNISPAWRFWLGEVPPEAIHTGYDDAAWELVSLPHTHEVFPADLEGFKERGRNVGWYRRKLDISDAQRGKRIAIEFQGAIQSTRVWLNGAIVGEHAVSGYDSFDFNLTSLVKFGEPNTLVVRVDNTPNPDLPPPMAARPTSSSSAGSIAT